MFRYMPISVNGCGRWSLLSHIFISNFDVLYDYVSCPMHFHFPRKLLVVDNDWIFAKHSIPAVNICCCSSKRDMLTFAKNLVAFTVSVLDYCISPNNILLLFITLLYRIGHISWRFDTKITLLCIISVDNQTLKHVFIVLSIFTFKEKHFVILKCHLLCDILSNALKLRHF